MDKKHQEKEKIIQTEVEVLLLKNRGALKRRKDVIEEQKKKKRLEEKLKKMKFNMAGSKPKAKSSLSGRIFGKE